jgi:membrane-associated phospholipid phosphatase
MRSNRKSIYHFGLIPVVIIASAFATRAQAPSPTPSPAAKASATPTLESQFFKNVLRDQKAIWTSPFHLHGRDARWLVPLALGTGALMTTDRQTGDALVGSTRQLNASRIISYAGSTYGVGSIVATFYLVGRAEHSDHARQTGLLGAEALVDSVVVGSVLKEIAQRTRPRGGAERSEFFEGGTSFPSGHSIQAWSVATVIAHEYHGRPAVQVAAYGIASAVSVARFTGRKHYLSDVLVGSALGYGIGNYVYHAHHRQSADAGGGPEEEDEGLARSRWPLIAPQYDHHSHAYGVALSWSF